ncbi:MAG TPA: RNA polymerase sigma factor [Polyangiaceae bacterium]|nr:RNA polymerase sigma factor [Polyangiaceae bacterium]
MTDEPRPSLRQIFDEHARYVWRTLRHLGISEADTPDLCQEVFVTVHRKLSSFEGRSSLRTWLYGICIRIASEHRRRPHVRREIPLSEPPRESSSEPSAAPESSLEQRRAVERLLSVLDEDKRQIVVLYEIEGFSMKEVAEIVECPLQTAYSRLHAARALMLSAFNAEHEAEP